MGFELLFKYFNKTVIIIKMQVYDGKKGVLKRVKNFEFPKDVKKEYRDLLFLWRE